MKINKCVDVYHCDCCGQEIGICAPNKMLNGCNYSSGDVSFEPKVMGDYCEECLEIAQIDWDTNNIKGFVSDRYDQFDEQTLGKEVAKMQELYEQYCENDPNWYYKSLERYQILIR